jgi:hypothetical protein
MRAKNSTPRAYMLRKPDGYIEPCAVVYALTAAKARQKYHVIDDATFIGVQVERRPEFDVYAATGGPTTRDLFEKHEWYFGCCDCAEDMVTREGDPDAVVVAEGRHAGRVRCGACARKKAA